MQTQNNICWITAREGGREGGSIGSIHVSPDADGFFLLLSNDSIGSPSFD